ncbi:MAG: multiple sugar transport system permease protein [Kosmotogales bacterium]|nr:multiple sugar transport system permease protein [Kosmotogales bacterium]
MFLCSIFRGEVVFRDKRAAWLFIAPALAFLLLFKIGPICVSFVESFMMTSYSGAKSFVGFENYIYLFKHDPVFWNSFKTTLIYSVVLNPLIVFIALVLALLLNGSQKFVKFFRTLFFLPTAISFVVVAVIWGVVMDPYYGLANSFLKMIGVGAQPFMNSTSQALLCIIFISIWRSSGYWMMYFLAGLQNIPESLYEAATIDGANNFQKTMKITIPLLSRTMSFVLVANTAFNFLTFAPVYILTQGGPNGSTNLLMYESYKSAFVNLDMGRATAISSILLLMIFVFTIFELRITKANFEY